MCVNYKAPDIEEINEHFGSILVDLNDLWKPEIWKDYRAPIVRINRAGQKECTVGTYGMVPRKRIPPGVRPFDTMNARTETIGQLRSFSKPWREGQLCLVPMKHFFEPCYESGSAVRWGIGMIDDSMFAVAGLWREWEEQDGAVSTSFTQLTMNADEHPLMRRFHKPGDEKRALVIVPRSEWDEWLSCRDPELARTFVRHMDAEQLKSWAAPVPPRVKKEAVAEQAQLL